MTKPYYECHITFEGDKRLPLKSIVEHEGWKFSSIDGDPSMGAGIKSYATQHFRGNRLLAEVVAKMNSAAMYLANNDMKILRQKVELIVYDTKDEPSNNTSTGDDK